MALLGDVTIDLSDTNSAPPEVHIEAYAILRGVDVLVGERTHVELGVGVLRGHLSNEVPPVPEDRRTRTVSINGPAWSATSPSAWPAAEDRRARAAVPALLRSASELVGEVDRLEQHAAGCVTVQLKPNVGLERARAIRQNTPRQSRR